MAPQTRKFDAPADIKVVIRNVWGKFLAGSADEWYFTENRAEALVFQYVADRVAEQLDALRRSCGAVLEAVPVPLEEVYETCDLCKELFMPVMISYDGKRFLCADCRERVAKRPVKKKPGSAEGTK